MRLILAATFAAWTTLGASATAETTIKATMAFEAKILDPIFTNATATRNHGFMIYDTLYAPDAEGDMQPQMVDRHEASADGLVHRFTLREGLTWHDGAPVTAEDCVASLKRWAKKDAVGQKLFGLVSWLAAMDARTFEIRLTAPTGQLIPALGRAAAFVPFMMPKRVAETPPDQQISDLTGSGPFVFVREELRPGVRAVYRRFEGYRPRSEPSSGLAGGKVVKVDRVEWTVIPDQQQQVDALLGGEIDYLEMPLIDLLPLLRPDPHVRLVEFNPGGYMLTFRFNATTKPFDDPAVRRAAWHALNQPEFLKGVIGDPAQYRTCLSMYRCGAPFETHVGIDGLLLTSDFERSKAILREAGYDGSPVVLVHFAGIGSNTGPIAKSLLERGGFKVDLQVSDFATYLKRRTSRAPADKGGFSAFMISPTGPELGDPLSLGLMDASCDAAQPGWPCDAALEKIRADFLSAEDPEIRKALAEAAQKRAVEISTHVPLGQFHIPLAIRDTIDGVLEAPAPVFWNLSKR